MAKSVKDAILEAKKEYHRVWLKCCLYGDASDALRDDLFGIWNKYAQPGSRADSTLAFGTGTIDSYSIDFYFGENESFKGPAVREVLSYMLDQENFHLDRQGDFDDLSWRSWIFRRKDSAYPNTIEIRLRFWYGESKRCQLVDSGKTQPIMEVQCE